MYIIGSHHFGKTMKPRRKWNKACIRSFVYSTSDFAKRMVMLWDQGYLTWHWVNRIRRVCWLNVKWNLPKTVRPAQHVQCQINDWRPAKKPLNDIYIPDTSLLADNSEKNWHRSTSNVSWIFCVWPCYSVTKADVTVGSNYKISQRSPKEKGPDA